MRIETHGEENVMPPGGLVLYGRNVFCPSGFVLIKTFNSFLRGNIVFLFSTSLAKAASISAMILTTEALITDVPPGD
jgi:hypothetical protein